MSFGFLELKRIFFFFSGQLKVIESFDALYSKFA